MRGDPNPEAFAREHLRHNVLALGADFSLFMIGLSFASSTTVLPAFAVYLGAPNVVLGAIPAVMTTGWFLPSLFAAEHTESLSRRLPFILRYTLWERVPFLVMGVVAFTISDRAPALALAVVLLSLIAMSTTGGILMPAWMDVIGRTIPTELRGRFFALSSMVSAVGGLAGSFATARILDSLRAPGSYGVCFMISAAFMAASWIALALVREPEVVLTAPPRRLGDYLRSMPRLLRSDRNLSWFLAARAFSMLGTMAGGFFTAYALRIHAAPAHWVGIFTAMLFAGQLAATFGLGSLADRVGHRAVIVVGVGAMALANGMALGAPGLPAFSILFAFVGLAQTAATISNMNVLLEFAPTPEERPTYVGLGNTFIAPLAFGAPIAAGLLADAWGFEVVFLTAITCGVTGFVLMLARVRDPRHVSRLAGPVDERHEPASAVR